MFMLFTLLLATTTIHAQEAIDSTKKEAAPATIPQVEDKKTETPKEEGKKSKKKKKDVAKEETEKQVEAPKVDSTPPDTSTPAALKKWKKTHKDNPAPTKASNKKANKKTEPPKEEVHAIPGAEAKALAEIKDKEDRTMKGPSGQKVFTSPKGGKYYINANGVKIFLKRDTQK
jgi:colicin import membrane protein